MRSATGKKHDQPPLAKKRQCYLSDQAVASSAKPRIEVMLLAPVASDLLTMLKGGLGRKTSCFFLDPDGSMRISLQIEWSTDEQVTTVARKEDGTCAVSQMREGERLVSFISGPAGTKAI